jgi:hypothetical protein
MTDTPRRDPQDSQFGAAAAEDQAEVDRLEAEGIDPDQLPDDPTRSPRAANKAVPQDPASAPGGG